MEGKSEIFLITSIPLHMSYPNRRLYQIIFLSKFKVLFFLGLHPEKELLPKQQPLKVSIVIRFNVIFLFSKLTTRISN